MMNEKVHVYSIHYNRPEFISWRFQTFKAHLKDDWDFTVINNARDKENRDAINLTANALGISIIQTFSETPFHFAGKHHADSLNEVWKSHMCKHLESYVMFMDGDCFLVAPFSVGSYMGDTVPFGGCKQQREHQYHYLTPTVVMANPSLIPEPETIDWNGIHIGPNNTVLDTGGGLHLYLERHPEIKEKVKGLHNTWHIKPENGNMHCLPDELLSLYDPIWHIEFFGNEFLHYCRSSNWDHQTPQHHQAKSNFVASFLEATTQPARIKLSDDTTIVNNIKHVSAKNHNFQMPNDAYFGWGKWST